MFPVQVFSHKAKLYRDYPEPWHSLQSNKVENLKAASAKIDGTVINPGEVFSFWQAVGSTSKSKGYRDGMTIADGKLCAKTGGGLCQLSNALYWSALHLGFIITERHRHSFDFFPDSYRTVPFGAGATVFFNYVDLRFMNNEDQSFYLSVYLDSEFLHIDIYGSDPPSKTYQIEERNHRFEIRNDETWRSNDLVRITYSKGIRAGEEHIAHHEGKVMYAVR